MEAAVKPFVRLCLWRKVWVWLQGLAYWCLKGSVGSEYGGLPRIRLPFLGS